MTTVTNPSTAPAAAETVPRPRRYRSTTRRLLTTELRLLARDPLTLTFVLVFPIVTMLIIGGSFGTEPDEVFPVNPSHWYVASYFTVVIGATGLIMLPVHIASYRERGVLRRFAASGFPRWSFALAQLAIGLIAIAIAGVAAPRCRCAGVRRPGRREPAARRCWDRRGFGRLRQHRRPARDPAPVRAGRAGDRAAALLPVVPARRRWAAAGGDVGRAAGDRGLASARPGEPSHPRAVARHRQRHRCAADDRCDRLWWPPRSPHGAPHCEPAPRTPTLVPMTERTARVAAPAALALFAALGVLMTDRATSVALASAAVTTAVGIVLAWRRVTGWPMLAGLGGRRRLAGVPRAPPVGEPVLDGPVRHRGLGRVDVGDTRGRLRGRGPCRGPRRRVAHGHRRAGVGRLVRRDLVLDDRRRLRPPVAAHGDPAEGGAGGAGRAVPRRGAEPDRRRGARRHRPRAHRVLAAHQRRAARPGRGPARGTSGAVGSRAADPATASRRCVPPSA